MQAKSQMDESLNIIHLWLAKPLLEKVIWCLIHISHWNIVSMVNFSYYQGFIPGVSNLNFSGFICSPKYLLHFYLTDWRDTKPFFFFFCLYYSHLQVFSHVSFVLHSVFLIFTVFTKVPKKQKCNTSLLNTPIEAQSAPYSRLSCVCI